MWISGLCLALMAGPEGFLQEQQRVLQKEQVTFSSYLCIKKKRLFYKKPTNQQATAKYQIWSHPSFLTSLPDTNTSIVYPPLLSLFCLQTYLYFFPGGLQCSHPDLSNYHKWMTEVLSTSIWKYILGNLLLLLEAARNFFSIDLYLCSVLDISAVFCFLLKLLFLVLPFFRLCWKAVTVHLGHGVGGYGS